eukprot:12785512-Alexandrium_andersonii.AAC.1
MFTVSGAHCVRWFIAHGCSSQVPTQCEAADCGLPGRPDKTSCTVLCLGDCVHTLCPVVSGVLL